jgi:AcrR family transcriptional regulator
MADLKTETKQGESSSRPRLTRVEAKARTREGILEAAETVFRREGYHGASLARIAAQAGFTTGAVYSTFASKADVMLALIERRSERRRGVWTELIETVSDVDEYVVEIGRRNAAEVLAERDWWAVVVEFQIVVGRDEDLRARYTELHKANRGALVEGMRTWLERTGETPQIPIEQLATVTTALFRGLVLEGLVAPAQMSEELFVNAQRILRRGTQNGRDEEAGE